MKHQSEVAEVRALLERTEGVERVLTRHDQQQVGLDHTRGGDLVAVSGRDAWFTYYFWQDDAVAPDYARTVDIHRKPGYDPVELFVDPAIRMPKVRVGSQIGQKATWVPLLHGSHRAQCFDCQRQPWSIAG